MRIFVDFDGTLVDAKMRMFLLFKELVKESALNFDEYWNIKRRGVSHQSLLSNLYNYSLEEISRFQIIWHEQIESPRLLIEDKLFSNSVFFLQEWFNKAELVLITARQSPNALFKQLNDFDIFHFFNSILVTEGRVKKNDLISLNYSVNELEDFMIGDTGADVECAKLLRLRSVAVLSGFFDRPTLEKYKPDFIINDIGDFNKLMN